MANYEYPTANFFEDEELFPNKKQALRNATRKNFARRSYGNFCQFTQPRHFQQYEKDFSDSSSSSSSDSEEEFYPMNMKPSKNMFRHQQQTEEGRKWFTVIDLEGLRPEEVTAKVNTKCRILVIKLKNVQPNQMQFNHRQQPIGDKLVRVIRLPENILLEQLRIQVILRGGRLIVKAPFTFRREQQGRFLPTWVPIRVAFKDNIDMDTIKYQGNQYFENQVDSDLPRNWISNKRFQRYWNSRNFDQTTDFPYSQQMQQENFVSRKWNKMHQQQQMNFNTVLPITEIVRDETTGKPIMLVKVNVFGFRTEEVRVRVEEGQRLLIVEATKHNQQFEKEFEMEQTLATKYLRREFILPYFLDVTHIDYRVLKNGLLIVKLPIVKNQKNFQQTERVPECGCGIFKKDTVDTENQLTNTCEWEKPLRA